MPDDRMEDVPPHDRRKFFAAGLGRLLRPLADYIEQRLPIPLPVVRDVLRPPGALPEPDFLNTCYRCGACADSCPAKCIQLSLVADDERRGTPFIDPDIAACVICDDLACMKACPSGALKLVDRFDIRIGLAAVRHDLCVRSRGEECRVCVERCPLGETAIRVDASGRIEVVNPSNAAGRGCVGCGICQHYCPTMPKAIITKVVH